MLTEEQYIRYYHKNKKTVDQMAFSKNSLNERQLASKYKKYVQKNKPKEFTVDEKWIEVREEVYERDHYTCQFLSKLSDAEIILVKRYSGGLWKRITPAHIFGKNSFPHLKYVKENIVILNQWSHSMLDNSCHPIYGKLISREERDSWWEFIAGKERIDFLKKL